MDGDLLAINNTLAEYCLAADEGRFEDWARCFTEDGEMHAFRRVWKGFDELVSHISAAPEGLHLCGLPHVMLNGATADVVVNFMFVTHEKEIWSMGRYVDVLARTGDDWKIRSRKVRVLKRRERSE
jgi:hypothetical protein